MSAGYRQPWLRKPLYDTIFILMPPFAALAVVWLLPAQFRHTAAMPVMAWVMLVLFIDVAHVYSTLYNTYLDRARFSRHNRLFLLIPVLCYVTGVVLHLWDGLLFWRILAYLAVFHFIRQQYGFMRLYSRLDAKKKIETYIDTLAIYSATIYPLIYWHCTPGRNFNWFIDGDFITGEAGLIKNVCGWLYWIILGIYTAKEIWRLITHGQINVPKNLVVAGTYISWYFGIIYFNGDMAFTLLNVVSHGIPYMALVWSDIRRAPRTVKNTPPRVVSRWYGLLVFAGSLILLAYLEEGLWDGFVWQDHKSVFRLFGFLPHVTDRWVLALLVPLLSLPQSTHYVLDGFIWRKKYT